MEGFWESKFKTATIPWGYDPSESAIKTVEFFKSKEINEILIPGIGYGRNAKVFLDSRIGVTGIEISGSAIKQAQAFLETDLLIHEGSVTNMPFDKKYYKGIFCYALIHLLNKFQRKSFIQNCYKQLSPKGYMVFTVISVKTGRYGQGQKLSKNRFRLEKGLEVFFYDFESAEKEFKNYGLINIEEINEPIKFMENEPPIKCLIITCKKGV
ncbi:MAG: methyltransferase domain-containing protein [Salinivirgaceae bacterium]|jgi:SAM-dependent methyltransferase|nr:methyltransferase domain-containing protein [Salinivirgaceae bacterium]